MASQRAEATALAIEDAALDLALELGYDQVTVDLICEKVGISQRTFFNHFEVKNDAIIGRDHPHINEQAARQFIATTGPLLVEAISLFALPGGRASHRFKDRLQVISSSPALLTRQIQRISVIEAEIKEILLLRLCHRHPERAEADLEQEASLATHLVAGVLRWIGSRMEGYSSPDDETLASMMADARAVLRRVLTD